MPASHAPTLWCGLLALLAASVATGCQGYQPLPIDPDAHRAAWLARNIESESLVTFARSLQTADAPVTWDPHDGLSLNEAVVVALFFNPTLRRQRLEALVPLAAAQHAGDWDDPELSVDGGAVLASVSDPLIIEGGFAITIPFSGRPGRQRELEEARHQAAIWQVRVAESELIVRVREAWLEWSATLQRRDLLQAYAEEVAPVRDLVMKMAAAGEAPQTEVRAFDLEILTATGNAQHLTREADRQRKAIVAMLGLVPEAPVELHPALDATVPDDTGFAADSAGLGLHRSAHDVAEAAVRLEIAKQYPDLTIGIHGGVEDGQARIGLGFGLPFPILNTNRSGIASSRAERRVTKAAWEETVELLAQRLADLRYALGNTRTHITFLADELAPVIDQQLEDVTHLAGMGQFDAALQLDALRQRHETRLALVDSKLTAEIARAQIDALLHPGRERNTTNTVESDQ